MDKKKITLPAIIVGIVVSPIASIVIYWLAIQINFLPIVPLPFPQPKDSAGLQPPHPNSPKLEPDLEHNEEEYIKPRESNNPEISIGQRQENLATQDNQTENLNPTAKPEEPIKPESIKPEEPIKSEKPIKSEEPTKQDDLKNNLVNNQQQQPPQNISESQMLSTPIVLDALENSLKNSWVTINNKTIMIETTLLNIIEELEKKISTKMSENENKPNELSKNQQWSTVGQQLIKTEEQITETVTKLYEIKPNEKGAENEKSVENKFNELGENKRWSIVGQQLIKTEVKVNDSITKLSQLKEKAKNQKNDE